MSSFDAQEDSILKAIRGSAPEHKAHMQISAYEGALLKFFLELLGAQHVLEIGAFVGYSTVWLQRGLKGAARVFSVEKNKEYYDIAVENMKKAGLEANVSLYNAEALQFLSTFQLDDTIDAVFIDAKKADYCKYLEQAERILRVGGMIIADNTLSLQSRNSQSDQGSVEVPDAIKEFNRRIGDRAKFSSIIIPTEAGLTVAIKK